jgi:hypothetical protein
MGDRIDNNKTFYFNYRVNFSSTQSSGGFGTGGPDRDVKMGDQIAWNLASGAYRVGEPVPVMTMCGYKYHLTVGPPR